MNVSLQETNNSLPVLTNLTDNKLNDLYDYLYGGFPAKAAYFCMTFIVHFLGPIILLGIVAFEKYGGDPQKRNIINRLQSLALINQIMLSLMLGVCRVWRAIFGLIDFDVMVWIESIASIFCANFILFWDQMAIIQFLYIVVWKRFRALDDEFWAFFLFLLTLCWTCSLSIIEHIPNQLTTYAFKMNTADLPELFEHIR